MTDARLAAQVRRTILVTSDLDAEVRRLTDVGATKLNEINVGIHYITLADPEGNEFDQGYR